MKQIVIIGASSGLGRRVARDFASWGWKVAVSGRREDELKTLQAEYPDNIIYSAFDVNDPNSAYELNNLIERNNGADVILIAAGVGFLNPGLIESKETQILQTNVVGFARMAATAFRYFAATRNNAPGRLAAITSIAGTKGIGIAAAYSASKRFQSTYIDALEQLANQQDARIAFTDIRPGFVRTDFLDSSRHYPMEMDVDYAAKLIEVAILKGKRVATIDWRWRLADALWRCIPGRVWANMSITVPETAEGSDEE